MPKPEHKIRVRKMGPFGLWRVTCPRCGREWTRGNGRTALERATTHLRHNHPTRR